MLSQLTIQNFAIVQFLELEFQNGMTSVTGETGAGKSIAIDALGLCLGNRSDLKMVRAGASKLEVNARFQLADTPHATLWLKDHDLSAQNESLTEDEECILRRVITKEGRSRSYINGTPVTLAQLKDLGQYLINIHSQHAHHSLLKNENQLSIIDEYSNHINLLIDVKSSHQRWDKISKELKDKIQSQKVKQARKQLLEYQIEELDLFAIEEGEFEAIESEHKKLANSGSLLENCQTSLININEGEEYDVLSLLQKTVSLLESQIDNDSALGAIVSSLQEGIINIEEAGSELRNYADNLEVDPEHFSQLENRMGEALALARKHQVQPKLLYEFHQDLKAEFDDLNNSQEKIDSLSEDLEKTRGNYFISAKKLSESRKFYATELSEKITTSIRELNMKDCTFSVSLSSKEPLVNDNDLKTTDVELGARLSPLGIDNIEFQVATNAGQGLYALSKVASGGELSRISLAIQVIISQKISTPTLIFDEVDIGISGGTAAVVGRLLRTLGEKTQILCVTHLPQVAGNGHHQMFVSKESDGKTTNTQMVSLNKNERIKELARLLGGDKITDRAIENAKDLLIDN